MSVLICGSFAFDNIMVFEDRFKNHILPEKIHILNVSFLVPGLRREYGGCAGNIAFNLNLLGGDAIPMGAVGSDFEPYRSWMNECGINHSHVKTMDNALTAQAFITTDLDDNQITAFHPGAMNFSHENHINDVGGIKLGIISPDGRDGMIQHASEFSEAGIPFVFDPGQGLPMFDGDDLKSFIEKAEWVSVNDYESGLMCERTGWTQEQIAEQVSALVVTRGGEGSWIFVDGERLEIPAAPVSQLSDPTGCGDAYRAGLLYGLNHDWDWPTTGRLASLMGAIKIEHGGTQNHALSKAEIARRYQDAFGDELKLDA
ncbi:MAG: carbohydrate kinase family protein [Pseudomonadota bacterium]